MTCAKALRTVIRVRPAVLPASWAIVDQRALAGLRVFADLALERGDVHNDTPNGSHARSALRTPSS
jgi:hypothetical protein